MPTFNKKVVSGVIGIIVFLLAGSSQMAWGQEGYEEWKKQYLKEFKEFQNKYDRQFHKMLKEGWEDFNTTESPDAFDESKPDKIPEADQPETPAPDKQPETTPPDPQPETETPEKEKPEADKPVDQKPDKGDTPKADKPPTEKPAEDQPQKKQNTQQQEAAAEDKTTENPSSMDAINPSFSPKVKKAKVLSGDLRFYKRSVKYKYYAAFKYNLSPPISEKKVAEYWKHMSTKDYSSFLEQVGEIRNKLALNDYGYARLLDSIGDQIYGEGSPESTLFNWFMLTQSDFAARIGFNRSDLYLLTRAKPHLFNTTYFTIDGKKYYLFTFDEPLRQTPSTLQTHKKSYPTSEQKPLDLSMQHIPSLPGIYTERKLSFAYRDTSYELTVPLNEPNVEFYNNYPNAGFELYFNSQMAPRTHEELAQQLEPILEGKNQMEQVNILLRFVQKAFEYKVDKEQFQREKYMFPEETLYYPASDCEDRSSLFAYLVEHLVGLDYVGLRFPNHLTVAVHFSSDAPEGIYFNHQNKKYYVADPTYINANIGQLMPQLQGKSPQIIDI